MTKQFVRVLAEISCKWEGLNPIYRAYVNDELFAERTWIWGTDGLEEMLQIEAKPGYYTIRFELVPPHLAELTVENLRVDYGSATLKKNVLRISG